MKKVAFLSAVALALTLSSCDKAEKLLFRPFESPLSVDVIIDPVETTEMQMTLGSSTLQFNLDEEISENTEGRVDGSVVGAIYLNEVAINLHNADQDNDLSNFETVSLAVSSGNSTPVIFGPFTIPANATTSASFTVANSPNIRQYFTGSEVEFELIGEAKATTNKTLQATISATVKFDK